MQEDYRKKSFSLVQESHLKDNQNISLSIKDAFGMAEFGLALGGQISEVDKTNTGKVIAECVIGRVLDWLLYWRLIFQKTK